MVVLTVQLLPTLLCHPPIQAVNDTLDIARAVVSIAQVVGVLPHIAHQQRAQPRHQPLLVALQTQHHRPPRGAIRRQHRPAAALHPQSHPSEHPEEALIGAEHPAQSLRQGPLRHLQGLRAQTLPIQRVQKMPRQMEGQIVRRLARCRLGQLTLGHRMQTLKRRVRPRHIGRVVPVVV